MNKVPGKPTLSEETKEGLSGVEVAAVVVTVVWLLGAGAFFFMTSGEEGGFDSLRFVLTLVALFLPIAVIWIAAASARTARIYREETDRLRHSIDSMRVAFMAEREAKPKALAPQVEEKLAAIAHTAQKTETVLATFTSSRQGGRVQIPLPRTNTVTDDQPSLALGVPPEEQTMPLSNGELVRALNFPESEHDVDGFAALRAALRDRQARKLVQASQDVLTLLSQDGIYMDDMRPDRARPEIWRRFAQGERGRAVAALGGIRDRSCLALTSARMKEDSVFRDAAHHFLRHFDQMLQSFDGQANDEEIVALSETRTARAFMLLGRVTGAFD